MVQLKRVYEKAGPRDGVRFLVERLWPRGLRKTELHMDAWEKEAAPSSELRKWFSHDPARWQEFQRKYVAELKTRAAAWQPILEAPSAALRRCSTARMTPNTTTPSL